MNDSAGQVRYDITANADDFIAQLKAAGKAIYDFGDTVSKEDKLLIMKWNNMADEMQLAIQKAAIEASKPIVDFVDQTITQVSAMNKAISSAALSTIQIVSGAATTAITDLARKGVEGADMLAQYNAQVIGLAETTRDANSAMSTAVKFFRKNPFQRFETVEAVKNLMMYDKSIASAATNSDRLRKTLDMLGIASLSSGTPIAELADKWGEVASQTRIGKGQFEELAMRIPALYDAVGKRLGVKAAEVGEAIRGVGIDTKIVKQAMEDLYGLDTEKLNLPKQSKEFQQYFNSLKGAARQSAEAYLAFGNTMARQTDRVKGRLADMAQAIAGYELTAEGGFKAVEGGIYQSVINLKKAFADALDSTGKTAAKMRSAFGKLGAAIAPYIDKLTKKVPDILTKLFDLVDKLGDHIELLLPILAGALTLFGGLASNVPVLGPAIEKITGPISFLKDKFLELNPALKILFALLGAGAFKAIKDGKLTGPLKSIFESLQKIGKALAPVTEQVARIFADVGERVVVSLLESLAKVLEVLANVISSLPTEVLTGFVLAFIGLRGITTVFGPIAQTIKLTKQFKESLYEAFNLKAKALGGVEKIKNVLNGIGDAATKAGETAEKAAGASGSLQKASTSMTKGQQAMKTMRSAILNIILLAGAIAAMGLALRIAYEVVPNDLGGLIEKLGTIAGVMVAFGAIAFAAEKVKLSPKALLEFVGIAGVLVILSGALWVVQQVIPNDLEKLIQKLGVIAGVIVAVGALAFVGGLGIANIALGLLAMVGIAGTVAILASALKAVSDKVPDDLGRLTLQLAAIGEVVVVIGLLAAGIGKLLTTGPVVLFMATGMLTMIALVAGVVLIATELKTLERINLNSEKIVENTGVIMNTVKTITDEASGKSLKDLIEAFLEMGIVAAVANIVDNYTRIAKNLSYIQKIKFNKKPIIKNIKLISEIVELLAPRPGTGVMGKLKDMINTFLQAGIVQAVASIVETYRKIAENLTELQVIYLNKDWITEKVKLISDVVKSIADTSPNGVLGGLSELITTFLQSKIVENVSAIVQTYIDISLKLQELDINLDDNKKVRDEISDKLNYIKDIVHTISTSGGDIITAVSNMVSSNAYSQTVQNVGNITGTFVEISKKLTSLAKEIPADEKTQAEMAYKLGYVNGIVKTLATQGESIWKSFQMMIASDNYKNAVKNVNDVLTVFPDVFGKIKTLYDVVNKAGENFDIEKAKSNVNNITEVINKVLSIKDGGIFQGISEFLSGGLITADKVQQVVDIIQKFGSIAERTNKIPDVGGENYEKIEHIKTVLQKIKSSPRMEDNDRAKLIGTVNLANDVLWVAGFMISRLNKLEDIGGENYVKIDHIRDAINKFKQIPGMDEATRAMLVNSVNSAADMATTAGRFVKSVNALEEPNNDRLNSVISSIRNMVIRLAEVSRLAATEFITIGKTIIQNLIVGITISTILLPAAGRLMMAQVLNGMKPMLGEFRKIGERLSFNYFEAGINSYESSRDATGSNMAYDVLQGIRSMLKDFYSAGAYASRGFENGLYSRNLRLVGRNLAQTFLDGFYERARQGSPWKTTYQSGIWAVEGMIEGLEKMSYKLRMAAQTMASTIVDSMRVDNLSDVIGFSDLKNISMSISGQGEEGTLGGVNSKSNTINIYNTNYAQSDFNQMSRDIMFNISRL